jgi:Type ISP C-terminal specificity domain/N-6 DNA Methylase
VAYDSIQIAEEFFDSVRKVRALGAGTPETAYYPALNTLFERVGSLLSPKVLALSQLSNTGSGSPDFGLFTANQVQRGEPRPGQMPERGVVEVKAVADDSLFATTPAQLSKYFDAYGLVLVTNLRAFQIVGSGPGGVAVRLEPFEVAKNAAEFWSMMQTPAASAKSVGLALVEYLRRALSQSVSLIQPKDVAWFLASYARDALGRVEAAGNLPALQTVRTALEEALGIGFEGEKGEHFFRSTLVQTLFYGLFSSWVIWARTMPRNPPRFDWRQAGWNLHVPFVATLFQQLTAPKHLKQLDLVEVLNWTGDTLNRIDATEFMKRFEEGQAVQYFYEPFLEAFDPQLRKQFGVWYTPVEIVDYMVARVDRALKEELGIPDGLADERVYVLDPCCGTGGYYNAVLRKIRQNLEGHGLGSALANRMRDAAQNRVFGFEIMPAPFVVAHMQAAMTLSLMNAPFEEEGRPAIYLTNALTGWEPHTNKPLPFQELEEERASADAVKQTRPILVVIGNPPYDGFAGISDNAEERALSNEYRKVDKVIAPQGQGLNELYVRFFRMAERRIAEKTGEGVIAFISNYSWLDSLSCTGMRERYLQAFDSVGIDNLHGDRIISERAPDGRSSATVFAVRGQSPGIKVGTAITMLVRRRQSKGTDKVYYRDFHEANADDRRKALTASLAEESIWSGYEQAKPSLFFRLVFKPGSVGKGYEGWTALPDLLPVSFPGVKTSRDEFLVDIDRASLDARISRYLDPKISNADLAKSDPTVMGTSKRYDPAATRKELLGRPHADGKIVRYAYRPFDVRWAYWDPDTKLVDEKRPEFFTNTEFKNRFLTAGERNRMGAFYRPQAVTVLGDHHLVESNASIFPMTVRQDAKNVAPNLSKSMGESLAQRGLSGEHLFDHVLAVLNAPAYEVENMSALRVDWPRIPVPTDDEVFKASASLGAKLGDLLDAEIEVNGVTKGLLKAGLASVALPYGSGFDVIAGWGWILRKPNGNRLIMPGGGKFAEREWTGAEREALDAIGARHGLTGEEAIDLLGGYAVDVQMNAEAGWRAVPAKAWSFTLGGYPVLKKWLSYREAEIIGRPLSGDEVMQFAKSVRRICEILCMGPALDQAYALSGETAASG